MSKDSHYAGNTESGCHGVAASTGLSYKEKYERFVNPSVKEEAFKFDGFEPRLKLIYLNFN